MNMIPFNNIINHAIEITLSQSTINITNNNLIILIKEMNLTTY